MGQAQTLAPNVKDSRAYVSQRLLDRLGDFLDAPDTSSRIEAFIALVRRLQRLDSIGGGYVELRRLIEFLENDLATRTRFQTAFREFLKSLDSLSLLAESGIPSDLPLPSEFVHRIVGRLMPRARHDADASRLLIRLYSSKQRVRQFTDIPSELFERLISIVNPQHDADVWRQQRSDVEEALRLLAIRVSSLGLRPEMRDRALACQVTDSPFYDLISGTEELLTSDSHGGGRTMAWQETVGRCRQEIGSVHGHMESEGVSVELVFDLKKIEACFARMESLVAVICPASSQDRLRAAKQLLTTLMHGRQSDRSLKVLLRENLGLVARKTVERTGHSGEHYIAHDRADYWHMWLAAAGGGLLTVITAAIKMRIVEAPLPPFIEGVASGTNYAVSFVLLQLFGLVLATKQPAATAATFAGIVRDNRGEERSTKFAAFVSRIASTQLAAALGNVLAVGAGCFALDWLWNRLFSQTFLEQKSAEYVYHSLHPLHSPTAIYAVLTGVILWIAALAGGWCENFATYYRLSDAIAEHPLCSVIGKEPMRCCAEYFRKNLGGFATSIVLGYLLGFTPVIGAFFGIPLDVRHVTLSSGTLALAAGQSGLAALGDPAFYGALAGIGVTFVLNLVTSFTIAGMVALRAYDVSLREQVRIMIDLLFTALRSPSRFILPPQNHLRKSETDREIAK
jgi:site-specific recombinase